VMSLSGWWFGTFFIFPNSWDDDPIWLIYIFIRRVAQPPTSFQLVVNLRVSNSDSDGIWLWNMARWQICWLLATRSNAQGSICRIQCIEDHHQSVMEFLLYNQPVIITNEISIIG
jgi:hypothetical protein